MLKDNIVTKANDLNLRAYRLNRTEQLLVLSVSSMIQPQDEDFKTYRLYIKDFMDLLNVQDQSKYVELPKITKGLMSRVIEIRKTHSLLQVCWFSSVEHKPGEGIIEIEFSPKLKPYLLNLKDNFVSYKLNQVAKLSSKYSIRVYELLKQNSFRKSVEFELNDFRSLIGLDNSIYPRYSNMKPKILLSSKKELKEKTDISFDFEEIKTGRKVTGLKFYIHSNKTKIKTKSKITKPINSVEDEIAADKERIEETPTGTDLKNNIKIIMEMMKEHEINSFEAKKIYDSAKGNLEYIAKIYDYFKDKKADTSFVGLIIEMVKPGKYQEPKKNYGKTKFTDSNSGKYTKEFIDDTEIKLLGWDKDDDENSEIREEQCNFNLE